MARSISIVLTDDLDGGVAEETVTFGLDGVDYEIDVSSEHASQLRAALGAYVNAARTTDAATGKSPGTHAPGPRRGRPRNRKRIATIEEIEARKALSRR